MPGLTLEREVDIIKKKLNDIKIKIINSDKIYSENIKNLLERIESLEIQAENIRNRDTR